MDVEFKSFVRIYLDDLTRRLNVKFWANLKERLAGVDSRRSELIPNG